MTTTRQHMLEDMDWLFTVDGEESVDVVIDGVTIRAMVHELDVGGGSYEGEAVRQCALRIRKGTMPLPRPGYTMTMDGELWTVDSVDPSGIVDILIMSRY